MLGGRKKVSPLLIASIGNPSPRYTNTLHSAGHVVLSHLRTKLPSYTPWGKSRVHGNGLLSRPGRTYWSAIPFASKDARLHEVRLADRRGDHEEHWTLWQSTSLMNVSGLGVRRAWEAWRGEVWDAAREKGAQGNEGKSGILVVLHDELEKPLGSVTVRKEGSARGHNGLKSVMASMRDEPFVRIAIGIGRPPSREPQDVSDYVLRKMDGKELKTVEGAVREVFQQLRRIEEGAFS